MDKCLICGEDADKENSHILSLFLIKKSLNYENQNGRDSELYYEFSNLNPFAEVYYGRNITPKKDEISFIESREVTDEELRNRKNGFTRDNIFCISCENKFGIIENFFSSNIYQKLYSLSINLNLSDNILRFNEQKSKVCLIFIYSLFLRCSLVNFNNFSLKPKIHSNILQIFQNIFSNKESEIINFISKEEFCVYPIICTFLQPKSKDEIATAFNAVFTTQLPYFILCDNISFQLFESVNQLKSKNEYLYGITKLVNESDTVNTEINEFKIAVIKSCHLELINCNIITHVGKVRIEAIQRFFRNVYKHKFKKNPKYEIEVSFLLFFSKNGIKDDKILTKEMFKNIFNTFIHSCKKTLS